MGIGLQSGADASLPLPQAGLGGIPGTAEGDDGLGCRGFAVSADEGGAGAVSLQCRAPVIPVDVPTPPARGFRSRCQGVMVGVYRGGNVSVRQGDRV